MKKIGILGGTFDPIHIGHLITAQRLIELRNLEKIFFIPAYISPHKTEIQNSSAEHRLNMVKLAIENIPYFDFSPIEAMKKEISYSIDTIKELKKSYNEIELIIGFDNIEKFYTWKNPDEILQLVKLIVMQREIDKKGIQKDKYFYAAEFVDTPQIDVSATEIRYRVKNNLPIEFLVPSKVKDYILINNLYK